MRRSTLLFAPLLLAAMTACTTGGTGAPANPVAAPVVGFVTDLAAFERFIATGPTPAEFRRVYPDVTLVLPGDIATKEFRMNNSRYFAEVDADGRIRGGRFS